MEVAEESVDDGRRLPLGSFPNLKELKTIVKTPERKKVSRKRQQTPRIARPKVKSAPQALEEPAKLAEVPAPASPIRRTEEPSPLFGAPISPAVLQSRQQVDRPPKIKLTESTIEPVTEAPAPKQSRFPKPNYGGTDLVFQGGEVLPTQIGAIEDIPREEVREILSGLGSRKRGLARPNKNKGTKLNISTNKEPMKDSLTSATNQQEPLLEDLDYLYDLYDYNYDAATVI